MRQSDVADLIAARAGALLVTVAPVAAPPEHIAALAAAGITVSLGHAETTDTDALTAFDAGARGVTHVFNAMSPLGHRAPGLVGAALADPRVVCGLIADGEHVAPTAIRVALAAKQPDGIALVSDAMPSAAGGPKEFRLQGRRVRRDGARLVLDDGTLAGSTITLMEAVRWLVRVLGLDLAAALRMASATPARLIGLGDRLGQLAPGLAADLVHLDAALAVRETWVRGVPSRAE
jgi:N-acetylglucosamine-6-phosphate deacetylase